LPSTVHVRDGGTGTELAITVRRYEVNPALADSLFEATE
jgi:hypothetical protein